MANFKIMRNGLNTEIVGDPHVGQSSEDVTVEVTDDGTYQEYDKKLYYSYSYRNQIYRAIADKNSSEEFIIPMTAFIEPGIVKLSLELSNGTNKPTCNACFIISTDGAKSVAASDILPDEETWQSYIQSYIKSNAEEFKGDRGQQGPKGEKGDAGSVLNLKIGGVNLLSGTKDFSGDWINKSSWNISNEKYNGFTVITNTKKNLGLRKKYSGKAGEKYNFSCYAKKLKDEEISGAFFVVDGSGKSIGVDRVVIPLKSDWVRYNYAITLKADVDFYVSFASNNYESDMVAVCGFKLEREETPTDWTPSLEDIENKFDNILARLEALESK